MYTVQWCDREGNQQERQVESLGDAKLEYEYLDKHYDGAQILDENGNPVHL